ncbi:MAG: hypothetical protein V1769_00585 [Thermoplasmatota archaeon]
MILKRFIVIFILCSILISDPVRSFGSNENQDDNSGPAEVNLLIMDKDIQSIHVGEWTPINLTLHDLIGIDYDTLKNRKIFNIIPLTELWKITKPKWRHLLGYTSLKINLTVIYGIPQGWYFKLEPTSSFPSTYKYKQHPCVLYARIDDSAVDYNIVLGINCTRYDLFNEPCGESILELPLKAQPNIFLNVTNINLIRNSTPKSIVKIHYTVTNQGYYKETISFKVNCSDNLTAHCHTPVAVLYPEEQTDLQISVLIPETFFDFGTAYNISVYGIRQKDGTEISIGTFTIIRQGIYLSQLFLIQLMVCFIILFTVYIIIRIHRNKKELHSPGISIEKSNDKRKKNN